MSNTNASKVAALLYQTVTGIKQEPSKIATLEEMQEYLYQIAIDPKSTKREVEKAKKVHAQIQKRLTP